MVRFGQFKRLGPLKKACPTAWKGHLADRSFANALFWTQTPFRYVAIATDNCHGNKAYHHFLAHPYLPVQFCVHWPTNLIEIVDQTPGSVSMATVMNFGPTARQGLCTCQI